MAKCKHAISAAQQTITVSTIDYDAGTHPNIYSLGIKNDVVSIGVTPNAGENKQDFADRLAAAMNAALTGVSGVTSASTIEITHSTNGANEEFEVKTNSPKGNKFLELECDFMSSRLPPDNVPSGNANGSVVFWGESSVVRKVNLNYAYLYVEDLVDCGSGSSNLVNCPQSYSGFLVKNRAAGK